MSLPMLLHSLQMTHKWSLQEDMVGAKIIYLFMCGKNKLYNRYTGDEWKWDAESNGNLHDSLETYEYNKKANRY